MKYLKSLSLAALFAVSAMSAQAAVIYATSVDSYTQGANVTPARANTANALGAPDGDFGMRPEVGEPETACFKAKDVLAGDAPERFRRSIEMADMQVAVDDDDSLARLLERRQQKLCRVDRGAIGGAHRLTL